MKKLILTILASTLILSCSNNSESTDPTSSGPLIKTFSDIGRNESQTYTYNGNIITSIDLNIGANNQFIETFTYNGNFIISSQLNCNLSTNPNCGNETTNYNYTNNVLTSLNYLSSMSNYIRTYTYNSDGTISENTTYQPSGTGSMTYYKRYFSQGNRIKEDEFRKINGVWTLQYTTTYTFDDKNSPFINILGWYELTNPMGSWENCDKNNAIGFITKNGLGQITNTNQTTYVYNSQNYPTQIAYTTTNSVNSTSPTTTTENFTITYY